MAEVDPVELEGRRWLDAVEAETGPLALFDTHTHFGRNDPDGYKQSPAELIAAIEYAGARAVTFPMHEPDGYAAANEEAREIAAASGGRIACFCRVDPHRGALEEAVRSLDAGSSGIKLHPRAEQFAMSEPVVHELVALADERGVPVLIHAGRGIPALGRDTLELASRHPGAHLILAHGAVSDLAWMWRLLPEHPNVLVDTSWWNPADLLALFSLVAPRQILWASDSPYGHPVHMAAVHLRLALASGLGPEAIAAIAGGSIERVLAGETPADLGPPPGPRTEPRDPAMERVCSHLIAALGRAMAHGEITENTALARLACDSDGEHAAACAEIGHLLDLAEAHDGEPPPDRIFPHSLMFLVLALAVARTPAIALPAKPAV